MPDPLEELQQDTTSQVEKSLRAMYELGKRHGKLELLGDKLDAPEEELLSECCSAKPLDELAYDNSGRCSDCKEGCMFVKECETSCGINADPADGFGRCTCGSSEPKQSGRWKPESLEERVEELELWMDAVTDYLIDKSWVGDNVYSGVHEPLAKRIKSKEVK